jgi:hypothetical protein
MNGSLNRGLRGLGFTVALVWVGSVAAQTADEIIAKNFEAAGGLKALAKVTSFARKGDVSVTGQFGDMAGASEVKAIVGKKYWDTRDLGVFYRTSGWNGGDAAWEDDAMNGLRDVGEEAVALARSQSQINPFMGYKESGLEIARLDDESAMPVSMDMFAQPDPATAKECYVLEMKRGESGVKFYIEKATGLLYQMKMNRADENFGEMELTVENTEYDAYDGVKLPKINRMKFGDMFAIETTYTETEINGEIDPAVFEKPQPPPPPVAPAAPVEPDAPADPGANPAD